MKHFKSIFLAVITMIFLIGCSSNKPDYFKLTFTDEPHSNGMLPEHYELNSNGKLVFLTNKFNEHDELYNRTYFIELNPEQLDSAHLFVNKLKKQTQLAATDSSYKYLGRLDYFRNDTRKSQLILANNENEIMKELSSFCNSLLARNKHYLLNHSYYFSTDEFCIKKAN